MESWHAQLDAEKDFDDHRIAVAKVTPRDENDLVLKAAAAAIYDPVKGSYELRSAFISYGVAIDFYRMRAVDGSAAS